MVHSSKTRCRHTIMSHWSTINEEYDYGFFVEQLLFDKRIMLNVDFRHYTAIVILFLFLLSLLPMLQTTEINGRTSGSQG